MQLRIYCFVVILEHQLIYLFSFSDRGTARGFQRDLPYGYELLGENLADISHLPFSHHSVGTLNRADGRLEMLQNLQKLILQSYRTIRANYLPIRLVSLMLVSMIRRLLPR